MSASVDSPSGKNEDPLLKNLSSLVETLQKFAAEISNKIATSSARKKADQIVQAGVTYEEREKIVTALLGQAEKLKALHQENKDVKVAYKTFAKNFFSSANELAENISGFITIFSTPTKVKFVREMEKLLYAGGEILKLDIPSIKTTAEKNARAAKEDQIDPSRLREATIDWGQPQVKPSRPEESSSQDDKLTPPTRPRR